MTKTNMAGVQCFGCGVEFTFFKREHSCKNCNRVFCRGCTSKSAVVEPGTKKERVCDQCYRILTKGQVQQESTHNKPDGKLNDLDKISQQQNHGYQERGKTKGFYLTLDKNIPPTDDGNENLNPDPDKELRQRLANLKNDPGGAKLATDEELGQRFSKLAGRTATCMQKSDINTPRPKKSEGEQVDDLLKKMMSEHEIDESSTPAGSDQVSDGEIEERLAKLKGIDPEVFKNSQVNWDSDEDEDTQMKKYLKQVLAEATLEDKTESMGIDISKTKPLSKSGKSKLESKTANVPQASGISSSSIWDKDYEADSDDDELPWCCICNANAVLRCRGCDNDLYCKRCYREGHSTEDFEDHPTTAYKPPRKQR